MPAQLERDSALLVVDVQNDFCPGGSLAVPEGDRVVEPLNRYMARFAAEQRPVYLSRDWHPARTKHFQELGGRWPPHCIQGTRGAEFHPGLRPPPQAITVSKGMDPERDSYSAFDASAPDGTPLEEVLRRAGVRHLYIGGLATDYCVKWTVVDARKRGFEVTVLLDAIRGVNVRPHDSEEAIEEMVANGSRVATARQLGVA